MANTIHAYQGTTFETENTAGRRSHAVERTAQWVEGGSILEAVGGISAVVLSILGLAGLFSESMAAIGALCIGAAMLFEGIAIGAWFGRVLNEGGSPFRLAELGGGMTVELIAGAAGLVLGILSLVTSLYTTLVPVAVLVFGGALLLGSGATTRFAVVKVRGTQDHVVEQEVARQAIKAAADVQALVGIAAVVLGILALLGIGYVILPLAGLLAVGTSIVLSGTAVGGRMWGFLHRE
ncbi:MAG TPA: hypothetical protein VL171_10385 [Verrucomicrobiae bacterium]|nr:hypothetical protein [Verrucomicrobiae bacterium]